jgi:hypothetical protein
MQHPQGISQHMADKKPKKVLINTPPGIAHFPWLNKADDRPIKGKPQKPAFKTGIVYDATNPAWLALKARLDAAVEESYDTAVTENPKKKKLIVRQFPYKDETDEAGNETGRVIVNFKQNAEIKSKLTGEVTKVVIPQFDAKGKSLPKTLAVFGGSLIKVSFSTRPYLVDSSNAAGVSLDLGAVQVLKLVTKGQRSADSFGFGAEDGYEYEAAPDEESAPEETGSEGGSEDASDPTNF